MTSKESSEFFHVPVLYEPTLEALRVRPTGIYVDCTTGGGGHAAGVLAQLAAGGLLICLDKDEQALQAAAGRLAKVRTGGTFRLVKRDFAALKEVLSEQGIEQADGILADLGVSSHQLDIGERGFSYNQAGPLDMRMDRSAALTAEAVVNTWSQEKLAMILRTYGEERFSARIAEAIVQRRAVRRFTTTDDLSELICRVMPAKSKRERQHPAKRSFQAIRIAVNGELDSLKALLEAAPELLSDGGRLAIISFHSLEDRLVKNAYRRWENPCECPPGLPCVCGLRPLGKVVMGRRGVIAEAGEAAQNARARSARLRVFERVRDA
jgi:16S rRNA (cytosine1402-N4)-methyltransferase